MINERTETFEGVTITVRARRGADVWDEFMVRNKLANEYAENEYRVSKFVEFVTRTLSVTGELGFVWPTVSSSADVMLAGYQAWCDMPPQLMVFWHNLMWTANQAPLPEANTTPGNA